MLVLICAASSQNFGLTWLLSVAASVRGRETDNPLLPSLSFSSLLPFFFRLLSFKLLFSGLLVRSLDDWTIECTWTSPTCEWNLQWDGFCRVKKLWPLGVSLTLARLLTLSLRAITLSLGVFRFRYMLLNGATSSNNMPLTNDILYKNPVYDLICAPMRTQMLTEVR